MLNLSSDLEKKLNTDYMPVIYKNIKKFRKECNMSLSDVAEILDMSYDYLRRIEAKDDSKKSCSLKLLIKFSILYNRPIDDFLKEE